VVEVKYVNITKTNTIVKNAVENHFVNTINENQSAVIVMVEESVNIIDEDMIVRNVEE
jgi:hypothetical protein